MSNNEKNCYNCGAPITKEWCENFPVPCESWEPKKPQTNFERIKAMTAEEVADMICYCMDNSLDSLCGYDNVLKWLKSEVQEE